MFSQPIGTMNMEFENQNVEVQGEYEYCTCDFCLGAGPDAEDYCRYGADDEGRLFDKFVE
jgi:hypothetical protein|tara:strand:+ start:1652 stop:1831 length:180 start_codon:yes stop_codon:yes gene_type:complete